MTILELREKRVKAVEAARAFLDTKRSGDGVLSPEDETVYDKMEAEIVSLGKEIEREERLRDTQSSLNALTPLKVTEQPGASGKTKSGRATDEYKHAFWNAMRGQVVKDALTIGTDSEGGYLVPDEFERTLVEALEDENIFRQFSHVIQTTSGDRKIPVVASKGTASWVEEEGVIPESDDAFGQITLGAYKLATLIKISAELVNDSAFNMEAYISKEFARRIGVKEEEAFFVGDGTGKPTGIFASTGGGEIGKTTTSATDITADEIIDIYHALRQVYRNRAVFVTNDATVKAIRKLKDTNGQYLWQPSLKEGDPDMLLGRRIYTSTFVPEMAAGAKALAFGDFSYYWIADRQGRIFQRLNELYAVTNQVGFIATQRLDGKLILPEAVKVLQMAAS